MRTAKVTWSVMVVYDGAETREAALSFCDQLVQRFWQELEFDVSWWPKEKLRDPHSAQHATSRAVEAHLVVFSIPAKGDLALDVQAWVEEWIGRRGDREGALVGLIDSSNSERRLDPPQAERYLREAAHRAGMDYLTQLPASIGSEIPESLESCAKRAQQVTSVLDEILRQQPPPPRWMT